MRNDTLCPIARACSVIADPWTILILRELRLGNDRFDGIQAQTGISSHLLASRLKTMEREGLVSRVAYSERPKRYAYRQTSKTADLDGLMLLLRQWGMRHGGFAPGAEDAVTMIHRETGAIVDADWVMPASDAPFSFAQVEGRINAGWAAERAARSDAFATDKRARVARRRRKAGSGDAGQGDQLR